MSKLKLVWGLLKVLSPEPLVAALYAGRRTVVDGRPIDPKAQAAGDLVNLIRDPDVMPTVEESRAQLDTLATKFDRPCPPDVQIRDISLPGLTGPRAARVYAPAGADPMAAQPTLFYLHGGGWIQGSLTSHHGLCGKLAKQSGLRVISYDYVLAPEHRFPSAPDDVLQVYRALLDGAGELNVSAGQLIVGGDSAGANLTAALMHDLATAGDPLPRAQLLIYPAVDGRLNSRSMTALADQPLLPKARIDWYLDRYLPGGTDRTDPRFSPLFSDRLAGQPPALIIAAGHDPLWDDALIYADTLDQAGVHVTLLTYEGQVHGFLSLTKVIPQGRDAVSKVAEWLREVAL
ncbi:alpha/beta hydrolase [Seohaeicola saemankumensis]|nr:alpha/beta hydrolase [Seohaeicola saemankumensis]MCA0870775.1 alpha/beta hydrolase [Seohaeicola saemankumensis]